MQKYAKTNYPVRRENYQDTLSNGEDIRKFIGQIYINVHNWNELILRNYL